MNSESQNFNIGCVIQTGQAKRDGKMVTYCFFLEISSLDQTWDSVTKNLDYDIRRNSLVWKEFLEAV